MALRENLASAHRRSAAWNSAPNPPTDIFTNVNGHISKEDVASSNATGGNRCCIGSWPTNRKILGQGIHRVWTQSGASLFREGKSRATATSWALPVSVGDIEAVSFSDMAIVVVPTGSSWPLQATLACTEILELCEI